MVASLEFDEDMGMDAEVKEDMIRYVGKMNVMMLET